jgi:hypothetical protein
VVLHCRAGISEGKTGKAKTPERLRPEPW